MDKYHIYEEIGKGEFSQVFKGREKKKIEYVAIKRVDKVMMSKIVNEVQMMHKFESPHILRFHDWYETRNNLWLILEYCTGADLESLLKQDGHLPETSVRSISLDILAGLKHMHSLGILHCDIRPSNIFIDEYGIAKISDFKFARKIPTSLIGDLPIAQRGHPPYMAPELFAPDGVHSYASELWSIGCLMVELRKGCLPFGDDSVSMVVLVEKIRTVDPLKDPVSTSDLPAPSPTSTTTTTTAATPPIPVSAEFSDVVLWLLEKAPMNRCDWKELSLHPFWGSLANAVPESLPPQPAYELMIKNLAGNHNHPSTSLQSDSKSLMIPTDTNNHSDTNNNNKDNPGQESMTFPSAKDTNTKEKRDAFNATTGNTTMLRGTNLTTMQRVNSAGSNSNMNTSPDKRGSKDLTALNSEIDLFSAEWLLMDESDSIVKPIVGNKSIETIEKATYKANFIQGTPLTHETASKLSQAELQSHLTLIYRALSKSIGSAASVIGASGGVNSAANNTAAAPMNSPAAIEQKNNLLGYLCSLAPVAEVANIILNTNFLSLLLRIIRTPVAMPAASTNSRMASKPSPVNNTRSLATTVLAVMLRFATLVQPPTIKQKDEHIIPTLIGVLKESYRGDPRGDIKLRKRAIAALGELLFYISAQEDTTGAAGEVEASADGTVRERWTLPDAALSTLTKALKEDSDETVRHYAAKTIENILAQGSLEHRRKLIVLDTALRLLDLSHMSRNETMQATCGTALAHMLAIALATDSSSMLEMNQPSPGSGNNNNNNNNYSMNNKTMKNMTMTLPMVGGRFVGKLFDRGGLQGLVEILRDGQPRLQQAYLNIINLIFAGPVTFVRSEGKGVGDLSTSGSASPFLLIKSKLTSSTNAELEANLKAHRIFLCKSQVVIPAISRLIEQGGTDIVRAKALLAAQLISRYQPMQLHLLGERRLPSLLVRLLEQPTTLAGGLTMTSSQSKQNSVTYLNRAALSMLYFLRGLLLDKTQDLATELGKLELEIATEESSKVVMTVAGQGGGKQGTAKGSLLTPVRQASARSNYSGTSSPTPTTPRTGRKGEGEGVGTGTGGKTVVILADMNTLSSSAASLRAAFTIVTLPALRRHAIGCSSFVKALSDALLALWEARTAMDKVAINSVGEREKEREGKERESDVQKERVKDRLKTLVAAEEALLVGLQTISQLDIYDLSFQLEQITNTVHQAALRDDLVITLLTKLIPATAKFASHHDGNVRVLIASALRRFLPSLISDVSNGPSSVGVTTTTAGGGGGLDKKAVAASVALSALLSQVPALLADQAPIPQYTIRLLADICMIESVAIKVCIQLVSSHGITQLIHLMRESVNKCSTSSSAGAAVNAISKPMAGRESDGDVDLDLDPQLAVVLRVALENSDSQVVVLEAGLSSAVATAMRVAVSRSSQDIVVVLLDLVHISLHLVGKALGMGSGNNGSITPLKGNTLITDRSRTTGNAVGNNNNNISNSCKILTDLSPNTLKELILPLASLVVPLLTTIFESAQLEKDNQLVSSSPPSTNLTSPISGTSTTPTPTTATSNAHSVYVLTIDSASASLTILFELLPEVFIQNLLAKDFVMWSEGMTVVVQVAGQLSTILLHAQVDSKSKFRILKIINGIIKVGISTNTIHKIKEILCHPNLRAALLQLGRSDTPPPPSSSSSSSSIMNNENQFINDTSGITISNLARQIDNTLSTILR